MASQQATYVQISRAREDTQLYVVSGEKSIERSRPPLSEEAAPQPQEQTRLQPPLAATSEERKEAMEEMKKSWSRDAAKGTSLDYGQEKELSKDAGLTRSISIEKSQHYEMER